MTTNGVLVLAGPPCAGKSSVGHVLAREPSLVRLLLIEVDSLFSLLLPGSDRNRDDRLLAYDAAHALARLVFDRGHIPVLECTYSRSPQRASLLAAMADRPSAPLWVVEFVVSPDGAVARFRRRHQATDLDEGLVRERVGTFPYSDQALRLDSSAAAPAELARRITAWLRDEPRSAHRELWAAEGRGWE